MVCRSNTLILTMEEIFKQRKVELELLAKNTIVEIFMIKAKAAEINQILEAKEKLLDGIDASIRELDHVSHRITSTLAAADKEATKLMEKEATKEGNDNQKEATKKGNDNQK